MQTRTVLYVDDEKQYFPNGLQRKDRLARFGTDSELCDPINPVESSLEKLRQRHDIVAILSDKCKVPNFEHLRKFRRQTPFALIAAYCGSDSADDRDAAFEAGAEYFLIKGSNLDRFLLEAADPVQIAKRRFYADLELNLTMTDRMGMWLAYTEDGFFGESHDDIKLIQQCEQKVPKRFYIGQVIPEYNFMIQRDSILF